MPLTIAPIVEGQGEVQSTRGLIHRIAQSLGAAEYPVVLSPFRLARSSMVKEGPFKKAVAYAGARVRQTEGAGIVLVLADVDEDCAAQLGPRLHAWAAEEVSDISTVCSLAVVEYETWFAASAESLDQFLTLRAGEAAPPDPEAARCGKAWVQERFAGYYSETIDQPRMTASIDVAVCRQRSGSFDRLCRHIARAIAGASP